MQRSKSKKKESPKSCPTKKLTLDEAIRHAEEVASRNDTPCGQDHRQLAEWLKELKDRREFEAEWELGPEYEFAYCSYCGHMQFADCDSYSEATEKIGDFHKEYRYCPNCGAKMVGENKEDWE